MTITEILKEVFGEDFKVLSLSFKDSKFYCTFKFEDVVSEASAKNSKELINDIYKIVEYIRGSRFRLELSLNRIPLHKA